jgi:hypothetical protein
MPTKSTFVSVRPDVDWKDVFVRTLRRTLSVARSCDIACVEYRFALKHKNSDPEFRKAWESAIEASCDDIEEALKKRAVRGYLKPIYWQGKRVGFERKFDTTAAMFLLRGRRKKIFGDARSIVTINNAPGGGIPKALDDKKLQQMGPEELQKAWEDRCKASGT